MVQQELITIYDDCANRLAEGATIEECLRLYPAYASVLRPLLETQTQVRNATLPLQEVYEDQALVWERIEQSLPAPLTVSGVRSTRRLLFSLAASIVLLLVGGGWFALPRLVELTPTSTIPFTSTATESPTATTMPSELPVLLTTPPPPPPSTIVPTLTGTPSSTATHTASVLPPTWTIAFTNTPLPSGTPTSTVNVPTSTNVPRPTSTPTMTFAPGCGAPFTAEQATNEVLRIFPNAVISTVEQITRPDGRLVWVVDSQQGIKVTVDVACGTVLTIDRPGAGEDNENGNTNDNLSNDNLSDDNSNSNDNVDDSGMGTSGMD